MPVSGETVDLLVERIVPGGDGLARADGAVVLVEGGLPGDRVRTRLRSDGPRLFRGTILSVLSPSPHRRDGAEVCPRALEGACGGCDWPAVRLESHRELKTAILHDALRRLGRLPPERVPEVGWIGSPRNYRLRSRLHVDPLGRVGFFAPRSNDVDRLERCELVSGTLLARIGRIAEAFAAARRGGDLEVLEGADGSPLLGRFRPAVPVADPERLARALDGPLDGIEILDPEGRSVCSSGPGSLEIAVGAVRFRASVASFFQGNRFLLLPFLDEARKMLGASRERERAVDLYAGGGFLTRPLLERGCRTTAVEIDPSSAADLRANLSAWSGEVPGLAETVQATAEEFIAREKGPIDLVVADPPRAGMSPEVRRALLRLRPRRLLLVSCDPATFARDVGELSKSWTVREITLIDLFPGTHHVETMALLERQ